MAARKSFLIRIQPTLLDGLRAWASQEMRSLNGQIEYLLREAVRQRGWRPTEEPPEEHPPSPRR